MSTYPILTNTLANGIGQGGNGRTFERVSGDSTYEYYQLHSASGGAIGGINDYSIKVHKANNVWSDHGGNSPTNVSYNTTTLNVELSDSGPFFYFVKPTSAPWITSTPPPPGGGTGTEGSGGPTGSSFMNAQGQLVFVITSTSPSSDGTIAYKIFRRLKGGTLTQAYVVPHTSGGTDTEFNIGLNLSLYDRWELRIESSTALVQSAVLSVHSNNKKVFCNFW